MTCIQHVAEARTMRRNGLLTETTAAFAVRTKTGGTRFTAVVVLVATRVRNPFDADAARTTGVFVGAAVLLVVPPLSPSTTMIAIVAAVIAATATAWVRDRRLVVRGGGWTAGTDGAAPKCAAMGRPLGISIVGRPAAAARASAVRTFCP